MINNLVVFCQNNHFRLLGMFCLTMATVMIFTFMLASATKRGKTNIVLILNSLASIVVLFNKIFMILWLATELVVILSKVLVF